MSEERIKNLTTILSMILPATIPILAQSIGNATLRNIFLLISLSAIIIYFMHIPISKATKKKKIVFYVMSGISTLLLMYPMVSTRSFNVYVSAISDFLSNNDDKDKIEELQTQVAILSETISNLNAKNEESYNMIDKIASYIENITSASNKNLFRKNEDISQISDVKEFIVEAQKEEIFQTMDFKNIDDVERIAYFYKVKLSDVSSKTYYYSNIIEAFKLLDFDIEKYSINEMTLLYWDLQYLNIYMNIKNDLHFKLLDETIDNDQIHKKTVFNMDDYKIKDGNNRDKTYYYNRTISSDNSSYSDIYNQVNNKIIGILNKIMNNLR